MTAAIARLATLGLLAACAAFGPAAAAQDAQDTQRRLTADEVAALPARPSAATPGVVSRTLMGESSKPGPYALAITYPPGAEIRPHRHRDHRNVVVLQGSIAFGYGALADRAQTREMGPGSYYTEAAETPHFGFVGPEGLSVYLTGWGPSDNRPEPAPN